MQRRTSVMRMTDTNIKLELSPRLQQEQIVTSYIFDLKTSCLVIELNPRRYMLSSVNSIFKSHPEMLSYSSCKRHSKPLNYRKRYCQDFECRRARRIATQKVYDRSRGTQKPKEVSA